MKKYVSDKNKYGLNITVDIRLLHVRAKEIGWLETSAVLSSGYSVGGHEGGLLPHHRHPKSSIE